MTDDYYAPWEIVFTRKQVLWLLQNLATLRGGYWPPEPSNYKDALMRMKHSGHKAPFITPIEFAAEIESRLEKCGTEGLILLAVECWCETESSLARYFDIKEYAIRRRYKRALAYVASGPARRWLHTRKRKGKEYQEFINKGKK